MNQFWRLFTLGGLIVVYIVVLLAKMAGFCAQPWAVVLAPFWIPIVCVLILFLGFCLKIAGVALVTVFTFKLYKRPFV